MEKSKKDIFYIHILRIVACLMVIINHTHSYIYKFDGNYNDLFYCLGFAVCKIGVPLFIMISGILILDKQYDYKTIFKKIMRMAIVLLLITLAIYGKRIGYSNLRFIPFIQLILKGPYITALWYIYMLIGLYLVTPFIQKMVKKFDDKDYLVFIIIFLLMPSIMGLLESYGILMFSDYFKMSLIPPVIGLYVLGNYLSKVGLSKKGLILSIVIFIISYLAMFSSMYVPCLLHGEVSYRLDSWNSLPVLLMSASFMYMVKYIFRNTKPSKYNICGKIASTTFGIYLIHYELNYKIFYNTIFRNLLLGNFYIYVLLTELATFIVCSIIIYIVKKIPVIKKLV